ncbi:MAG: hypothetical protein R3D55_28700, partial [Chloroflexota bacterium]
FDGMDGGETAVATIEIVRARQSATILAQQITFASIASPAPPQFRAKRMIKTFEEADASMHNRLIKPYDIQ